MTALTRGDDASDREAKVDNAVMFASYEQFMADKVVPFIQAAYAVQKPDVQVQADGVQKAFRAQHSFIRIVAACKRPSDDDLAELLQVPLLLRSAPPSPSLSQALKRSLAHIHAHTYVFGG